MKNQPKGYDCKQYYSSSGSTALQSENCFQLLPNCWDDLGGLFFLSPTWKLYHYFLGLKSQQLKATRTIFKSCSPLWWVVYIAIPHTRTHWTIGIGELTKAVRSGNHIPGLVTDLQRTFVRMKRNFEKKEKNIARAYSKEKKEGELHLPLLHLPATHLTMRWKILLDALYFTKVVNKK